MPSYTSKGLKKGGRDINALQHYLSSELQSAMDAKGGLLDRWELAEKIDRNDPSVAGTKLFDNVDPRAVPSLSPRINRIENVTMSSLTGNAVMVQAIPDDREQARADQLERGLQTTWERGGFERKFRMAMHTALLCGVSVIRQRFTPSAGMVFDPIHPGDFVCANTYGLDLADKHLVGHRFFTPRWKAKEMVKSGDYELVTNKDVDNLPAADPSLARSGRDAAYDATNSETSTERDNDLLELYELIIRIELDGKPERCKVVYSQDGTKVLSKEPYIYSRPWYFDVRFHDEYGKFWPSGSVAQDIVGLCLLKSDMFNLTATGSMAACAPPVVISGGTLGKKHKSVNLAQIYETPYDLKVQQIPISFDPGAMPAVMEMVDRLMESATGVTDVRLAAERKSGDITATQISAEEQAAAQNEGSYPAFVADVVEQMAKFWQEELIVSHSAAFRQYYGKAIPAELYGFAVGKVRWQVTGRKPGNSPHLLVQKLQMLWQMSQGQNSAYHPQRTEKAMVEAMQLPINTEGLEYTREELAQIQAAKVAMAQAEAQAQSTGQKAPGSDPGLDGGMVQG